MKNYIAASALAVALLLGWSGCAPAAPGLHVEPDTQPQIVFSRDVLPLLRQKFAPLLEDQPGLRWDSWDSLMEGSPRYGSVLIPFDADRSLIVQRALQPGTDVSPAEIDVIRRWIEAGARNDAGVVPYADAGPLLYVCNQGGASISVVDMERNLVIRTVDLQELGFSENARPHHIAVEPDGSHWYVSLVGENRVLKFDRDNRIVGQAPFEVPGMLALDPTSSLLYVGRSMSAVNPPQSIGVIDRSGMDIEELDVFFPRPHPLAVNPRTGMAYSGSMTVDQIAAIDGESLDIELNTLETATGGNGATAHTGHMDHGNMFVQFAIAPDSPVMVVGGEMTGQVLFLNIADPQQPTLETTVAVNAKPWDPVYTPDGRFIYLGNNGANTVTVLDAKARSVAAVISGEGLSEPYGSAIRPDGRYVYLSNSNLQGAYTPRRPVQNASDVGTVTIIDTATRQIVKVLEVGPNPTGIGAARAY